MGSLYKKNVIQSALNEVGYQANGKWNKYADDLDKVDYFTGCGKKQGLDWCCVFVNWCIYQNTEPDPDVWDAHYFLYQSDSCDTAAVVKYAADFFKKHNAYDTDTRYACTGDQIFFKNDEGELVHTGIVVDWDDSGIYTVEGNTNGGQVAKKFYSYSSSRIAGFGHPRYDQAPAESAPVQDPTSKNNIFIDISVPEGCNVYINNQLVDVDKHIEG
jgi:hypothetical protein